MARSSVTPRAAIDSGDIVLVARLAENQHGRGATSSGEHFLDQTALADLVHEALVESRRNRGAGTDTSWGDAAEAASLILQHVADVTGSSNEVDSESETRRVG